MYFFAQVAEAVPFTAAKPVLLARFGLELFVRSINQQHLSIWIWHCKWDLFQFEMRAAWSIMHRWENFWQLHAWDSQWPPLPEQSLGIGLSWWDPLLNSCCCGQDASNSPWQQLVCFQHKPQRTSQPSSYKTTPCLAGKGPNSRWRMLYRIKLWTDVKTSSQAPSYASRSPKLRLTDLLTDGGEV